MDSCQKLLNSHVQIYNYNFIIFTRFLCIYLSPFLSGELYISFVEVIKLLI